MIRKWQIDGEGRGMNDRRKEARDVKNSIGRAFFAALALVLQIGWIVSLLVRA